MKIERQVAMESSALSRAPHKPATKKEQRLREKCQEFEAILLQRMVEVMQADTNLFGRGVQGEFFGGMFAEVIAKELAKNPGLGLTEDLIRAYQKAGLLN